MHVTGRLPRRPVTSARASPSMCTVRVWERPERVKDWTERVDDLAGWST
jgi:hypothetical protein